MNNETDSKWSPSMLMICAIFLDIGILSCLIIMPLFNIIQEIFKLIYLTIISWFHSMSSIFRHWKNRLRCSSKRHIHQSRSSIFNDNEMKTVNVTMDKLLDENRILKERFDKLEERCQRWIADEQIYFLKRIEQLENENHRLHDNYQIYQRQSEKCLQSVTDLIIKTLFTQEELRKQCTDLHNVIDIVQLRKKVDQNQSILRNTRSISCQFATNSLNVNQRHTTNDQSTWLHQPLMIVEENDQKKTNQPLELHISESQSSVYSPTMTATQYKSRIPSTGLTNELYFSSHKPNGDDEKTPPVLMRNKRRSPHLNIVPIDGTPNISNNRRPISSPIRSTTYVLQQHHRINNNQNNITNKKLSSPVHQHQQQSPTITPMTLNKNRQTQQQRTFSNHERLPIQNPSTVDSSTTNQQFTSRTHITLTPRRTSPIVKSIPTKTITTTYVPRSPRIPNTPPVRPSRPTAPSTPITTATATIQTRSPRIPIRSSYLTPTNQRTYSSSPTTTIKSIRSNYSSSKSPEPLRSVTGTVIRPRPTNTIVNKAKMGTANITSTNTKTQIPIITPSKTSTPRVSDLDALMAEKHVNNNNNKISPNVELKPPINSSVPIVNNIRRSLFSTDSVKVIRPVRSQELKIFSSHLTTETSKQPLPQITDEISSSSNIDETFTKLIPISSPEQKTDNQSFDNHIIEKNDDTSSNTSAVLRDLSEDSLNSLNEHYHIRQLLKSNASITATNNDDSIHNSSSNEDIPDASAITWSHIRSSCESNISQLAPLKSETSTSPAFYNGPIRQEDIHLANDGRYFLLIDDNLSSEESQSSKTSLSSLSLSRSISSLIKTVPIQSTDKKSLIHRLVFPSRLGRIVFYRRILSDSDIYQKLCSKDNEINHNVYHLDTIRDYAMEFYMLTTYGSDSQLRAWFDSNYDETGNNTCYFEDNRFQSFDDDDDDDDDEDDEKDDNQIKMISSSDSIIRDEDLNRIQADEELDWYSELESFNLSSNNQQWKQENVSSCSSEDHVGELLRAERFSVSSLTTTTSADSSSSAGLISASWPLTNGIHYQVHSNCLSQSLASPLLSNLDDQSSTILKEILTYPWTNEITNSNVNCEDIDNDQMENNPSTTSVISDEFQPDFYYLCPLKNTTSFLKTDEKSNGIHKQLSHDV